MAPAKFRRRVAPLGVPTCLIADDRRLLDAAVAACPDSQSGAGGAAIEISLETASRPSSNFSCRTEVEGSRLRVEGADFQGFADADAKCGRCCVPPRLADDPELLSAELLDPVLLFLLTRSDRTPLHAAGVMIGDAAVLLSGPSGSGKSSLAQAAVRRGLRILSDDTVYMQLQPRLRLWGLPRPIHLIPAEAPPGTHPIRTRGGRRKAAIGLPAGADVESADRAVLVFLKRGDRPELARVSAADARSALAKLDPGFDLLADQSSAAAEVLAKDGAWRLTLGSQADDAIDLLLAELPQG